MGAKCLFAPLDAHGCNLSDMTHLIIFWLILSHFGSFDHTLDHLNYHDIIIIIITLFHLIIGLL